MKRNLIVIVGVFLIIIALMVTGDIITIGEKLTQITGWNYAEHGFYLLMFSLFFGFIIMPIVRVHRTPKIPELSMEENRDVDALVKFAEQLSKNMAYIPDKGKRISHVLNFRKEVSDCMCNYASMELVVQKELDTRFLGDEDLSVIGVNKRIKEWAKTVFMITAISQNSKFDTLSVVYMNYKMVEDIILASGFRPNNQQLFKMYVNILSTSLITYCMSEALSTTSGVAPFDFGDFNESAGPDEIVSSVENTGIDVGETLDTDIDFSDEVGDTEGLSIYTILRRIRIPGVVVGSVIDGTLNALMTLRIGYITRTYLQQGAEAFKGIKNKRAIKRQAMKDAVIAVPSVILSGSHVIGKKATDFILNLILRNDTSKKEYKQSENVE